MLYLCLGVSRIQLPENEKLIYDSHFINLKKTIKMKTSTFIIALFAVITNQLNAQQLPNADFESWNKKTISEPEGFFTSNVMVSSGSGSVSKVSDAYHGLSAVKLETLVSGKDTVQGMLVVGMPGEGGISGGVPFSGTPDSISGYAKFNILPTDTAFFIIAFKKNGNYISQAMTIFTGSQVGYKRFSIPTYLNSSNVPDSLVAIITSSRMDPPRKTGSTLTIDSISFLHSTQQFPNNDFENWSTLNGPEDPDAWGTYAAQYPTYHLPILVSKTVDAHSGTYAVKLVSDTGYVQPPFGSGIKGDTIVGMLQLNLVNGYMSTKYPFAFKPDSITGYVKGTVAAHPENMNFIWIQLSKNGTVIGQGVYQMQSSISTYTRFSSPITYTSALTPDSMIFIIFASNPTKYYPGNSFYVDDLAFIYKTTGLDKPSNISGIAFYPNPVTDQLHIQCSENGIVRIYNTRGMLLKELPIVENLTKVSTNGFSPGLYLYRITNESGKGLQNGKFVKE